MTEIEFIEMAVSVFLERGGKVHPDITLDIMMLIEKDEKLYKKYSAFTKKEQDELKKKLGKYIKKQFGLKDDKIGVPTNGKTLLMKSYTRFKDTQETSSNETTSTMQTEYHMPDPIVKTAKTLLDNAGQIILQGAPGCGKTYITTELAVYLCDGQVPASRAALKARYKELETEGRIGFTTFHQSLDYEEFVEGMKPDTENTEGEMRFIVKPGIFKQICTKAAEKITSNFKECYNQFIEDISDEEEFALKSFKGNIFHVCVNSNRNLILMTSANKNKNGVLTKENIYNTYLGQKSHWYGYNKGVVNYLKEHYGLVEPTLVTGKPKTHVLIIDEINRANISKVLGELITLIEKTKRIGAEDEFCVTLPYSGERFGVPQNLYIIGTMNTADRSLGYIDYAIRRRFAFLPLKSEWSVVREFYGDRGELMDRQHDLYTRIRNLVKNHLNEDFLLDDVMIGHSYFLAATEDDYRLNLDYKIRPLLEEYLRDGILVEDGTVKDTIKNLR